jgi:hypothetical protein
MYQRLEQKYNKEIDYLTTRPKAGLVLNLKAYRFRRKIMDVFTTIAAYICCIGLALITVLIIYGFYLILP